MKARGMFVTGTDTGVGKTLVAAALARNLRERGVDVAVAKPFLTGGDPNRAGDPAEPDSDTSVLIRLSGVEAAPGEATFSWFAEPMSPYAAAKAEGKTMDVDGVCEKVIDLMSAHEFTVVEGIGGVLVPLDGRTTVRDFIKMSGLPALVVARAGLGTLNHTLLTVEALNSEGIEVAAVVLNADRDCSGDASAASNKETLRELISGIPVLGPLPHVEAPVENFDRFCREGREILEELCDRLVLKEKTDSGVMAR